MPLSFKSDDRVIAAAAARLIAACSMGSVVSGSFIFNFFRLVASLCWKYSFASSLSPEAL